MSVLLLKCHTNTSVTTIRPHQCQACPRDHPLSPWWSGGQNSMRSQPCNHKGGIQVPNVCTLPHIHHIGLLASRSVCLILERRTVAILGKPSRSLLHSLYKQWRICVKCDNRILYNTSNTVVNTSEGLLNLRVNSGL